MANNENNKKNNSNSGAKARLEQKIIEAKGRSKRVMFSKESGSNNKKK